MSKGHVTTGAAISQLEAGHSLVEILGSFESKLDAFRALASLVMEAKGQVVDSALPMSLEVAYSISDLGYEWEALHHAILRGFDRGFGDEVVSAGGAR